MMKAGNSKRNVKLRPIKHKTGRQMLEELGYKAQRVDKRYGRVALFSKENGRRNIFIYENWACDVWYLDKVSTFRRDEVIALAQMIKDGELQ